MPQAKLGGGQGLRAVSPLKLRTTGDQDVEPILDGSWKMLFLLEMFYLLVLYLFSWKYTRLLGYQWSSMLSNGLYIGCSML